MLGFTTYLPTNDSIPHWPTCTCRWLYSPVAVTYLQVMGFTTDLPTSDGVHHWPTCTCRWLHSPVAVSYLQVMGLALTFLKVMVFITDIHVPADDCIHQWRWATCRWWDSPLTYQHVVMGFTTDLQTCEGVHHWSSAGKVILHWINSKWSGPPLTYLLCDFVHHWPTYRWLHLPMYFLQVTVFITNLATSDTVHH